MYRFALSELYPFPAGKDTALQEQIIRRRRRLQTRIKQKVEAQLKFQYARLHPKIGRLQRKLSERRRHFVKVVLGGSSVSLAAAVVCIVIFQFVTDSSDVGQKRCSPNGRKAGHCRKEKELSHVNVEKALGNKLVQARKKGESKVSEDVVPVADGCAYKKDNTPLGANGSDGPAKNKRSYQCSKQSYMYKELCKSQEKLHWSLLCFFHHKDVCRLLPP